MNSGPTFVPCFQKLVSFHQSNKLFLQIFGRGLTHQVINIVSQLHLKVVISVLLSSEDWALVVAAELFRKDIMQYDVC